jgi:DNA-binding GntR family transcriptional regulator
MSINLINKIKKLSLTEEIAGELRQSILTGKLKPNTRLFEKELAEQLGVSRGPLREALRLLEGEGVIVSSTGRGSYVNSFSERKVAELYSIRIILEQEAARLAAKKADQEQLSALEQILHSMFQAAEDGDLNNVIDLDIQFHQKIWEIADHTYLQQILNGLSAQIRSYVALQTNLYEDLAAGISNHKEILDSLMVRDGEGAANILRQHLDDAATVVIKFAHSQELKDEVPV